MRTLQQGLAALMETDSLNAQFDELNELVSNRAVRAGNITDSRKAERGLLVKQTAPTKSIAIPVGPRHIALESEK